MVKVLESIPAKGSDWALIHRIKGKTSGTVQTHRSAWKFTRQVLKDMDARNTTFTAKTFEYEGILIGIHIAMGGSTYMLAPNKLTEKMDTKVAFTMAMVAASDNSARFLTP